MITLYYPTIDWLTGVIIIFTSIAIYFLGRKSLSAKLFSVFSFITGIWSCLIAVAVSLSNIYLMQLLTESNHFLGTLIASIFFLFALSYPYDSKINRKILVILIGIEILFIYLLFFTNSIIFKISTLSHLGYFGWTYGPLSFLFNLYFTSSWLSGIVILFRKFINTVDLSIRKNLRIMLLALIIGITPPTIITILLPQIGIFDYYWLSPVSGLLWILLIAYSITRHHLFNIRIIAIEIVTFTFWIILFSRALLAKNIHDVTIESILLIIAIVFGITLIRSVLHEVAQRERIVVLEKRLMEVYDK
jgi:hypothetical protein